MSSKTINLKLQEYDIERIEKVKKFFWYKTRSNAIRKALDIIIDNNEL
jgi:hypothetical protein